MKYTLVNCVLLLLYFISIMSQIHCTCVLESDFGFIVNCNFKKSGLFRVRNLGGVKAHFGLGFSLGDELGFGESLGNLEANKRRSLNMKTGSNSIGVYPASKLSTTMATPTRRSFPVTRPITTGMPYKNAPKSVAPIPPFKTNNQASMTLATSLPLGVPAFKPIPPPPDHASNFNTLSQSPATKGTPTLQFELPYSVTNKLSSVSPNPINIYNVPSEHSSFHKRPQSISRISTGPIVTLDKQNIQSLISPYAHEFVPSFPNKKEIINRAYTLSSDIPLVDLKGHSIEELAAAANVSVDVIRSAIIKKQMKLEKDRTLNFTQMLTTPTTTTTIDSTSTQKSTTVIVTKKPPKKYYNFNNGLHKVMNAPKEYYPVGYEKNFDDNFTAKVDLPHTSFHCGDQKHFPGLYGDEDLGCMVFHVCALTDDGLIMKSFLCPESTLFDQTILKCNWWFYVDCQNSKSLYDSNLPISKSYQLMKALSFFSKYKSKNNETGSADFFDVKALKSNVVEEVIV